MINDTKTLNVNLWLNFDSNIIINIYNYKQNII
jgi:hypothetical protein